MSDENGLVYMRARYYSPTFKRFINADVVAGSITNAITLNRYAYANGNPVSNVDPFGLSAERGSQGTPIGYGQINPFAGLRTEEVVIELPMQGYIEDDCLYPDGWYASADEAAYAFGVQYNGESISSDTEIGTGIYSKTFYFYDGQYRLISEISRLQARKERSNENVTPLGEIFEGIDKITLYQYGEPIYGGIAFDGKDYFKYVDIKFVKGYGKVAGMVHTNGNFSLGGEEFFSEPAVESDGTILYRDKGMAFLYRTYGIKHDKQNTEKGIEEFVSYLVNPLGQLKRHTPSTNLYNQVDVSDITAQYAYLGYEIPAYND